MNDTLKKILKAIKSPKGITIVGIAGIVLIFLSSVLPKSSSKNSIAENEEIATDEYCASLQKSVSRIVTGLTGDKNPTVVITLESGVRYTYADAGESDTSSSSGGSATESRESTKRSYVTVKDSDGSEKPLVVTQIMPQIRGVAVICDKGDDTATAEKIKNAVTAALDITSKRVYISGGKTNEKG